MILQRLALAMICVVASLPALSAQMPTGEFMQKFEEARIADRFLDMQKMVQKNPRPSARQS